MYNILLVDDEPLIRKGLLKIIDWESLDCKIIHAACNGNEALNILNTQKIDIIISDIKMPGMSGIDLAQYVYENFKTTKVILLTGYSDFQFAQSAIKYNVVDFILKPTSTEKIISSVIKAKESLLKNIDQDSKIRNLEERMMHSTQKLQVNTLNEIINNIISADKIEDKLQEVNIELKDYYLLVSEIKHCDEELLSDIICTNINTIIDIFPLIFNDTSIYNILQKDNKLCTLISFSDIQKEEHSIVNLCSESVAMLKNFRCCNVAMCKFTT